MSTKQRGKVLMDQKANSVADLAAVLLEQDAGPGKERVERSERRRARAEELRRRKGESKVKKRPIDVGKEFGGGAEGVRVFWANLLDAEFAERWPRGVVHDELRVSRYTAAFPVAAEAEKVVEEGKGEADGGKGGEELHEEEEPKQVRRWAWLPNIFSRRRESASAA